MLLTITNMRSPATDLGYLLHKNPARMHSKELPFGNVHVFYPEASDIRCTAAILLDIDPVGLVRGRAGSQGEGMLDQYVNDRPYVASSLLSVALGRMFAQTMAGKCKDKPEIVDTVFDLEVRIPVIRARKDNDILAELFTPLGYEVEATPLPLDTHYPEWGMSDYYSLTLRAALRVCDLLCHLYVLIPVLDYEKHYYVGEDEVEKLLRKGDGWLESHPLRDWIVQRYLKHQRRLTHLALDRLTADEGADPDEVNSERNVEDVAAEAPVRLHELRLQAVLRVLQDSGATSVIDLGCGDGKLLRLLLAQTQFSRIAGTDVCMQSLLRATDKLNLDRMPEMKRERITLFHGSLMYLDDRFKGYEAAAVVEVIEHMDEPRLKAFEQIVFGQTKPGLVVVTTPNAEYNVLFPTLLPGTFRHRDHRFEWSRAQFHEWSNRVAQTNGYRVRFDPIGPEDSVCGPPSQMAIFES
ncbi:MAG: 3' terminal RNA ribose 2'-O-methyltransferase Hen1 [Candidatus Hydrogenedentota bacterium]